LAGVYILEKIPSRGGGILADVTREKFEKGREKRENVRKGERKRENEKEKG
jgi:hypothetical protein